MSKPSVCATRWSRCRSTWLRSKRKRRRREGQRAVVVDLIAKEEALRRRQESDVKDHQAKIARIRKQMDLATTTVQVTAFEHEIAFAQAEISRLEDAEIESMERSEGLDVAEEARRRSRRRRHGHSGARACSRHRDDRAGQDYFSPPSKKSARPMRAEIGESRTLHLRPHRQGQGNRSGRGAESEVHGLPDDGASAALERPARPQQRRDHDDLRELRPSALLRSRARLSAAQDGSGRKHRSIDHSIALNSRLAVRRIREKNLCRYG